MSQSFCSSLARKEPKLELDEFGVMLYTGSCQMPSACRKDLKCEINWQPRLQRCFSMHFPLRFILSREPYRGLRQNLTQSLCSSAPKPARLPPHAEQKLKSSRWLSGPSTPLRQLLPPPPSTPHHTGLCAVPPAQQAHTHHARRQPARPQPAWESVSVPDIHKARSPWMSASQEASHDSLFR